MRQISALLVAVLISVLGGAQSQSHPVAVTIACKALDAYTDSQLKVTVIVFHQRDQAQRSELAVLLHNYGGSIVQMQGDDGSWRDARMIRLQSCFGRGLLLLSGPSTVAQHGQFLLRVPDGAAAMSSNP
jgi:hypothetical protein